MSGLMIVFAFILLIVIFIGVGIICIRNKARDVSRELFGTSDLGEISKSMREQTANTPKSVYGATSLMLPRITKDFPDFNYDEMKHMADNTITNYLMAVNSNKTSIQNVSSELNEQLRNHVEMLQERGLREHFEDITIHRTEICDYRKIQGRCVIKFQSAVGCFHYITDDLGAVQEGSKEYHYQTRFTLSLEYIQNQDIIDDTAETGLGLHCPNCGAPISTLGHKNCEYCGSPITEFNIRVWKFCHIEEKK